MPATHSFISALGEMICLEYIMGNLAGDKLGSRQSAIWFEVSVRFGADKLQDFIVCRLFTVISDMQLQWLSV